MRLRDLLACSLLFVAGCKDFPVIAADECGNAVIEDGEDCDTFVGLRGAHCRPRGVEGECHFDCGTGSDGSRYICPEGMGCAADGLCRLPTGGFERRTKFASTVSSWLSAADFDGDGRTDIISSEPADQVQQARFHLHYFDRDSMLEETRTFPRFTTRPFARDLTGDGRADLVFSNFRIGMVPGRADRDWVPATFSSYQVQGSEIRVAGAYDDFVGFGSPLLALTALDDKSGIYVPDFISGTLELRAELEAPVARIAGEPTPANLIEGGDSPCDEIVVAFRDRGSLRVFDVCTPGDDDTQTGVVWRDAPLEHVIALPEGLKIDAGPIAADVDGDSHLDVLIGAQERVYVAYGDGSKLESVASPLPVPYYGNDGLPKDMPMPLAAGDITGDGIADYVLPNGVWASRFKLDGSGVSYFRAFENRSDPWSMARIADINGNELPDVVAAAAGSLGLALLNGTGGPYQIAARLATRGPVRFLIAGDFDGDLIDDMGFVEQAPTPEQADILAIAFGVRDGAPLESKRVAELSHVQQLGKQTELGMDILFASSSQKVGGVERSLLTLFDGSPDRLPFATYTLTTFSTDAQLVDSAAPALLLGDFGAQGAGDVMALGMRGPTADWALWLLPEIGAGEQPPRLLESSHPESVRPVTARGDVITTTVASGAGDLDGDGLDEALWLMPDVEVGCSLLVYGVDVAAGRAEQLQQVAFDEPCTTPELALVDLDGDAALDVLVLLGRHPDDARRLAVLWNDSSGRLQPAAEPLLDHGHDVRGFFAFGKEPRQLAFVDERGLSIARPSPDGDARRYDQVRDLDAFDDARSVVVSDPNGDQLPDIVVADAEGLWLLGAQLE